MFEVLDRGDLDGAHMVRGTGVFVGQIALFFGPEVRDRAEAYARWLNNGVARQRRRTDPGFAGGTDPER